MNARRRAASFLLGVILAACAGTPAPPAPAGSSAPAALSATPAVATGLAIERAEAAAATPSPATPPAPAPPPTPGPAPVATLVPTPPEDPVVGRMAVVVTDTRLAVRTAPGTGSDSKVLDRYLYPRQRAEVLEGPVLASGYPWYRVRVNEDEGWVAGESRTGDPWLAEGTFRAITAGGGHTCALTSAGGVTCWGYGGGALGDITGLASGVIAIAAGADFTCALTSTGRVQCWGSNRLGELGDGTTTGSRTPVDVAGLTGGVRAIAAGDHSACALTSAGGVKCWGVNEYGQPGDGTTASSRLPVDVVGLASGVRAIAAGAAHTCALMSTGGVRCWGRNEQAQLGDGTTVSRSTPVEVAGLPSGVSAIAAGSWHTCILTSAGVLKCWGRNGYGQLGDGTTTDTRTPVDVAGLPSGVTAIDAGGEATCAVTGAGGVACWGRMMGRRPDGTPTRSRTPVDVAGLPSGVAAVAVGGAARACALTTAGGVKCWLSPSVPADVDFSVHQTITLHASATLRDSLPLGTTVTFTATVRPPAPPAAHPTVRFFVRHVVAGTWVLATKDIGVGSDGQARLDWTLSEAGKWSIRASALANESQPASTMRGFPNLVKVVKVDLAPPTLVLAFLGSEASVDELTGDGRITYWVGVANWQEVPAGLFAAATDVPRCPDATLGTRTWVSVRDRASASQRWCGLRSPAELARIGFSVWRAGPQPDRAFLELFDRRLGLRYRSNVVTVSPPPVP